MEIIEGKIEKDIVISDEVILLGMIVGEVVVNEMGIFHLNGILIGNIIVKKKGSSFLHGRVRGDILNEGGYLKVTGIVDGNIIKENGETIIEPGSTIKGKIITRGKADAEFYNLDLDFKLPPPWDNKRFKISRIGYLNFLVGPNATGKTRFVEELATHLNKCRLLKSDRIIGLDSHPIDCPNLLHRGSDISEGLEKDKFDAYKEEAVHKGIGSDAFAILEENLTIRIKIAAILTQIFGKEIRFKWDNGKLVPMAYSIRDGNEYRLHTQECHGIKELLVLLTHLYDDSHRFLIIDEPELNLHPQYQAYLIQEIRKVAGNPELPNKKVIFLITHSPITLDIRTKSDLRSIICFNTDFESPTHLLDWDDEKLNELVPIIPRLNYHHKQLFFSDIPVFVEGDFDAQIIKAIQEKRGISMEASGSCLIPCGGNSEVALYYKLIESFRKKAMFIYDLDSLFTRMFRESAKNDEKILDFLAKIGAGDEFQKVCSEFESEIRDIVELIKASDNIKCTELIQLKEYINKILASNEKENVKWKKARISFLIHLDKFRDTLLEIIDERKITLVEKKFKNILDALKEKNVFLLKGGALENYLPSYKGNIYEINPDVKKKTIEKELEQINAVKTEELSSRYGYLFEVIKKLPGQSSIEYLKTIKNHLADFLYKLQRGILSGRIKNKESIPKYIGSEWSSFEKILRVEDINITIDKSFICKIIILDKWGIGEKKMEFTEKNNPGTNNFELDDEIKAR